MGIEELRAFFGWCTVINFALVTFWASVLLVANDFTFKTHTTLFDIPREKFNVVHYAGLAYYKVSIFLFNLTPYIALVILSN